MNEKIIYLRSQKKSFQYIAKILGISRQAVSARYLRIVNPKNNYYYLKNIYYCLQQRCTNKNNKNFKDYGGRGIKCLWKNFNDFKHDMSQNYTIGMTIERKNNNGDYCKQNCFWVKKSEQTKNRRPFTEWNLKSDYWLVNR